MKSKMKFHIPFSPTIMETEVPKRFLDIVNEIGDEVLSDDKKSAQFDWSNHLVGKVHKEVQIPIVNKEDGDYCKSILKGGLSHIPKTDDRYESCIYRQHDIASPNRR